MDHLAAVTSLQSVDLPAFMCILEDKYGRKWMDKNFAFMGILCEGGSGGMFRTLGNGSHVNLMKVAHAAIRSIAKTAAEKDPSVTELQILQGVLTTLCSGIAADFGREGIPDSIFKAMMQKDEPKNVDGIFHPDPHDEPPTAL